MRRAIATLGDLPPLGTDYGLFTRTAGSYLCVYRNERGDDHPLVLKLPSGRLVRDLHAPMPTFVD